MPDREQRYSVFLSHNSRDKGFVEIVASKLAKEGLRTWFDKWELIPGNRWQGGLGDGVLSSDACVVFVGPHNLGNWEAEEIDLAQTRAADDPRFRVIPVLLPGVSDPFDPTALPPFLRTRTWVDFRKGIEDREAFHLLICGIKGLSPKANRDAANREESSLIVGDRCPYRGLQVFNETDAQIYFGRAADIQRLVEKLKGTRFLAIVGASGSGKSSLARAGLIPRLRSMPDAEAWQVFPVFSPGSTPLETLVLRFAELPGANPSGLLELLRGSDGALHAAVSAYLDSSQRHTGVRSVLLLVDQLEQVFTLCKKESDRSQFLANLLYAGSVPGGRCFVVSTIRADFYNRFGAYPEFAGAVAAQQFLVGNMQYEGLIEAIKQPAKLSGLEFEGGLIETIADDVMGQPGALPLLQHALLELWQRRKDGRLTLEAYIDTGRVQGAIAKRADAIYELFSDKEKTVMQRIMLRLAQPGEGTEDTKRPAALDELITAQEDQSTVEHVVNQLTDQEHRLLTSSDRLGTRIIEISHEALIRGWETLRGWLDEDREGRRLLRRLSDDAREWKVQTELGCADEGLLYRGVRLDRVIEWRKHHESELNPLEREFTDESVKLKERLAHEQQAQQEQQLAQARKLMQIAQEQAQFERRARIRQRSLSIGLAVLSIITTALAVYIYRQYEAWRSAELAAQALRISNSDQILGMLLAQEAVSISPTSQAEVALRDTVIRSYLIKGVLKGHVGPVNTVAISPDGGYLLTASDDGKMFLWDVAKAERVSALQVTAGFVTSAAFSPGDPHVVLTTSQTGQNRTAQIWTSSSLDNWQRWDLPSEDGPISAAAFIPGGNELLVIKKERESLQILQWWNTVTRTKLRQLSIAVARVLSVRVSRNGTLSLTTHEDGTARVWDQNGRVKWEVSGHEGGINSGAFTADATELVTASDDKTARVWDTSDWHLILKLTGHTAPVRDAEFDPDGRLLVTASEDGTARVWDRRTGTAIWNLVGHSLSVNNAVFSPGGQQLATASDDNTVRIWDLSGREILAVPAHSRAVTDVVFRSDGQQFVTTSRDRTAQVWDSSSRRVVYRLPATGALLSAAFSPDGTVLVTASYDGTFKVWDLRSGTNTITLKHDGAVNSVAFSHDGKRLVTASDDQTARVWDAVNWTPLWTFERHHAAVNGATFSPDDRLLVTVSSDKTADVWDLATQQLVKEWSGHEAAVLSASFSFDGRRLVTASSDKTVRVWDTSNWRLIHELTGHTDAVFSANFSTDDRQLLTASRDKTARVWDVASGKMLWEVPGTVQGAAFSPDRKILVTAGGDGTVRIFDCAALSSLKGLLTLAKQLVRRELTLEERKQYL